MITGRVQEQTRLLCQHVGMEVAGVNKETPYEIQVRTEPARWVISVRAVVPNPQLVQFFEEMIDEMESHLSRVSGERSGPPFSIWHSPPEQIPGHMDIEVCVPVSEPVAEQGRLKVRQLPAGNLAVTLHKGPYDNMVAAFDAVSSWMSKHNRQPAGPPRDIILVGPRDTTDPAAYRTEVAYPL